MRKTQAFMNKPAYVGLSILDKFPIKVVIHELRYDYIKTKHKKKNKTMLYGYRKFYFLHKNG